jgi:hypothetical protein
MQFFKWDLRQKKSEENFKVCTICETIELYRIGWRDYMLRMPDSCPAKTVWNSTLKGCSAVGRPRKK